jgi:RHS repeat-associated protein
MKTLKKLFATLPVLIWLSAFCPAQTDLGFSTPLGGTRVNGPDLQISYEIPIFHKNGRGLPMDFNLTIYNAIWVPVHDQTHNTNSWATAGASMVSPSIAGEWGGSGGVTFFTGYRGGCHGQNGYTIYSNFGYTDKNGTSHPFAGTIIPDCSINAVTNTYSIDGSGYYIQIGLVGTKWVSVITAPNGTSITNPDVLGTSSKNITIQDANGNQIQAAWTQSTDTESYVDTLGTTAFTGVGLGNSSSNTYTYTGPSGSKTVTVYFGVIALQSRFGCAGITEFTGGSSSHVPIEVLYPDGSSYQIAYEPSGGGIYSTGRISSITLPTGGTVMYSYTGANDGITCPTTSPTLAYPRSGINSSLSVTSAGGTTTFSRTAPTSPATGPTVTTVVGPMGERTVTSYQYFLVSRRNAQQPDFHPVQTQYWNGSDLALNIDSCYDGDAAPCVNSIIQSYNSLQSGVDTLTFSGGLTKKYVRTLTPSTFLPASEALYDFTGNLFSTETVTYGSWSGTACVALGNNIANRPCQITIQDGSNSIVSSRLLTYDEAGSLVSTVGTPNLAPISGSRGNLTTASLWTGGTNYLTTHATYFDTGLTASSTDVNGAVTNFTYGQCGNSLLTSIQQPLSLTDSFSWESTCKGAVMTSQTDENNQITGVSYGDTNFWRPTSVTDPLQNSATISYLYSSGVPSGTEVTASYNSGNSVADVRTNTDSYGRSYIVQRQKGPSLNSYDSVQISYNISDLVSSTSRPYVGVAGATGTAPVETYSYDALRRLTIDQDAAGGWVHNCYYPSANGQCSGSTTTNDILVTSGPEEQVQKQYEFNALGRLTSVCELTTASGSGPCNQTVGQTGYLTTYSYNVMGDLMSVTQGSQTRSFTYDKIGRMLARTLPESGLKQFFYDTAPTTPGVACANTIFMGDLVKIYDANGNTICLTYDALHRHTSSVVPSGGTEVQRYLVYDSATVNGIAMQYANGYLAEAYAGSPSTKINDMGFSYSKRGELATTYESKPNATTYISAAYTYDGIGNVTGFSSSLSGMPSLSFSYNGQGQLNQVTSSDPNNPVWANNLFYNADGGLNSAHFGTATSAINQYGYDNNTGNLTSILLGITSGTNISISPVWNKNGTVASNTIVDPNNTANSQTCSYTHDSLGQLASVNCGASVWQQNFTYDVFGNISKSVPSGGTGRSWNPGYLPNNQVIGSSYDSNGNMLGNALQTFGYNVYDEMVTASTGIPVNQIHRTPFGEESENNSNASWLEFLRTGVGTLLYHQSSGLAEARIDLPGGVIADYSNGSLNFLHSDFRGNVVAKTTSAGNYVGSQAFAPYGESYAVGGTLTNNFFMGLGADTVNGMTDTATRQMQWASGRFIQPDPSGHFEMLSPRSFNQYAYTNLPMEYSDPSGMDGEDNPSRGDGMMDTGTAVWGEAVGGPNPDHPAPAVRCWLCLTPDNGNKSETGSRDDDRNAAADKEMDYLNKERFVRNYLVPGVMRIMALRTGVQKAAGAVDTFNSTLGFGRSNCGGGGSCTNALGMAGAAILVAVFSDGASEEATLARSEARIANLAKNLAKKGTLEAAEREINGGMKIFQEDGRFFDHANFVNEQIRGLENKVTSLERFIQEHPGLSDSQKERALSAIRFARDTAAAARVFITPKDPI